MNKQVRRLSIALLICFTVLFVQLNVMQIVKADDYNSRADNTREIVRDFSKPRGQILSADGRILADSVPSGDSFDYLRVYPTGDLFGQVTGYFSFLYGTEGVERQYNDVLAGRTDGQRLQGLLGFLDERPNVGNVTLTLRADLQAVAQQALGDRTGSVVGARPSHRRHPGHVLQPELRPEPAGRPQLREVKRPAEALLDDPGKPLLVKPTRSATCPARRSR